MTFLFFASFLSLFASEQPAKGEAAAKRHMPTVFGSGTYSGCFCSTNTFDATSAEEKKEFLFLVCDEKRHSHEDNDDVTALFKSEKKKRKLKSGETNKV